jgi:hypothetical protein
VSIIDPDGLFGGDRLRRCSNIAQLHWPRLFLASDGFARLELNYAKIVGRAYPTFKPIPTEMEMQAWLKEYVDTRLLFVFEAGGQLWGQWDTRKEFLPRYKTAADRRSPIPPESAFAEWKRKYREENKAFPKYFGEVPESFLHGVGVGGGKYICASDDARDLIATPTTDDPPTGNPEPSDLPATKAAGQQKSSRDGEFEAIQHVWFEQWWTIYWRKRDKKKAWQAFRKHVRTLARFEQVMKATAAQRPEMLNKEEQYMPHGATWLNAERWDDEITTAPVTSLDDYPELPI